MGSINKIFHISDWKIKYKGKSKIFDNDIIYNVIVGICDDEISFSEINYFFSESIYHDILNNRIQVKKFPYAENPILLIDESMNIISPVNGINNDIENYNDEQIENVKILKNRSNKYERK